MTRYDVARVAGAALFTALAMSLPFLGLSDLTLMGLSSMELALGCTPALVLVSYLSGVFVWPERATEVHDRTGTHRKATT